VIGEVEDFLRENGINYTDRSSMMATPRSVRGGPTQLAGPPKFTPPVEMGPVFGKVNDIEFDESRDLRKIKA